MALTMAGALVAWVVSFRITRFLKYRATAVDLKLKTEGSSVHVSVPVVTNNWGHLERSIGALSILSPPLAIVQGWRFVETAIRNRGKSLGVTEADDMDALSLAIRMGKLSGNIIDRLNKLNHFRNVLVHSNVDEWNTDQDVIQAAQDILPLILEIGSPWIEETQTEKVGPVAPSVGQ
jgi:hypothetical protein